MMMRHWRHAGLAALLGFTVLSPGCGGGSAAKDELVIGEYGSLTGNDADFGQSTRKGVEMALDQLLAEKQGKVGGLTVRAVVEDEFGSICDYDSG